MKKLIVALALLVPAAAQCSQVSCVTESVQALVGSTCSIGEITFNFYSASSTAVGQNPLSLSAVTFTPGGTAADPSFTLSGAFTTLSQSQSPFSVSEYVGLNYSATVSQSGSPESVNQVEALYSPTDYSSQFTYQDGSGTAYVSYVNGTTGCSSDITVIGSQISVSSYPCPSFGAGYPGGSFDGFSAVFMWSEGSVTSAHLDSGTSTFFVGAQAPESATVVLLAVGMTCFFIVTALNQSQEEFRSSSSDSEP